MNIDMKIELLGILNRVKRNNSRTKMHDIVFEEVEKFIINMSDDFDKTEYRNLIRLVRKYRGQYPPWKRKVDKTEPILHWKVCETLISNFNCVYKQFKRICYIIGELNNFFIADLDRFGLIYKVNVDKTYCRVGNTGDVISSKHSLKYFIKENSFKIVDKNYFLKQLHNLRESTIKENS